MEIGQLTPVRLRKGGKYMGEMDWEFYFASLVRRLEALWVILGEGEPLGKERWLAMTEGFRFNRMIIFCGDESCRHLRLLKQGQISTG